MSPPVLCRPFKWFFLTDLLVFSFVIFSDFFFFHSFLLFCIVRLAKHLPSFFHCLPLSSNCTISFRFSSFYFFFCISRRSVLSFEIIRKAFSDDCRCYGFAFDFVQGFILKQLIGFKTRRWGVPQPPLKCWEEGAGKLRFAPCCRGEGKWDWIVPPPEDLFFCIKICCQGLAVKFDVWVFYVFPFFCVAS